MTREEIQSNIEKLSELRAEYNCFDEEEESFYHALLLGIKGIKALEQEPCGDAISRQAVIDILSDKPAFTDSISSRDSIFDVKHLPPVNPQQRTGWWVDDKCSICGKGIEDLISSSEWYINEEPNFCPFCGVKIKIESKEEESDIW